ncbi:MAG: RNA polymerase sigma factor [Pirellulaceae bacterium]|nr:MAG: RNA polymerase sigma factor [Pirellulaceae bacterium]
MSADDNQAIERTKAGDAAAFAALVERYQQRLLGLLWHACHDRALAEDLAQDTFTRAYEKLHTYNGRAGFYTWLVRIAMNLLISYRRKKRMENTHQRSDVEVALEQCGASSDPHEFVELTETQQYVREAVQMLDEERRTVLLLRDFDGHDYETIAEMLELPIGTVRSRLHRARLELKSILEAKLDAMGW